MKARKFILPAVGAASVATFAALAAKPAPAAPPTLEEQMLSHVERVLVVDSLTVDKYEFFRKYKLSPSSGRILSGDEVAAALGNVTRSEDFVGQPFTGFTNEFNDYMIWAQEDTTGYIRLAESVRLIDGTWSEPEFTPTVLNNGDDEEDGDDEEFAVTANAAFPFMLDDGQTLYFAADNGQSLGGYDIFIASKDPSDGEFLIPGNLGMPFNSPYDDYMLAVDSETGVGWWATDRNQLGDKITIYIYALTDERVNVDPDDEFLMAYATLSGWESLLNEEQQAERERLRREIAGIKTADSRNPDFLLPMPGGRTYRFFSDFRNQKAASQMQLYLAQLGSFENREKELSELRGRYARGDRQVAERIRFLEEQLRNEEATLRKLLSEIYKLETNNQ